MEEELLFADPSPQPKRYRKFPTQSWRPPVKVTRAYKETRIRLSADKLPRQLNTKTWREYAYVLLNGHTRTASLVQGTITAVVLLNLGLFVAATVPELATHTEVFTVLEAASVILFTFEYGARMWSIVETRKYAHPLWGRLKYASKFISLVDALAIFPWYLGLIIEASTNIDVPATTALRVFRLFRLAKTESYGQAFSSVKRVLWNNREILVIGALLSALLLLSTATLLYWVEGDHDPNNFGSIPKTLFLAVLMLTGQGIEYDGKGYSTLTLFIIAVTAAVSVAVFTIPSAMLAWAFEAEAERLVAIRHERARTRRKALDAGIPYVEPISSSDPFTSSSSSSSFDSGAPSGEDHPIFSIFKDPASPGLERPELRLVLRTFGYDLDGPALDAMLDDLDPLRSGVISYPALLTFLARRRLQRVIESGNGGSDDEWAEVGRFGPDAAWRARPVTRDDSADDIEVDEAVAVLRSLSPQDRLHALSRIVQT